MPRLRPGAGAGIASLLLALAACGRAQPGAAPPAANDAPVLPVANEAGAPATMAPPQSMGHVGAEPAPEEGDGPKDRFVVCPGNPRCPPDASQPKGGRGN